MIRLFKGFAGALALAAAALPYAAMAQELLANPPHSAASAEAQRVGERLFAYDQAAWHATDRMVADMDAHSDFDTSWLRGFLVMEGWDGKLEAVFYGEREGVLREGARYQVDGRTIVGGGLLEGAAQVPLSDDGIRMVVAREAAFAGMVEEEYGLCAEARPNTVIFPPDEDGQVIVYVLTPMLSNEAYPLGGHYRFTIDAEGKIASSRRFLNSCLAAPLVGDDEVETPTGFFATHLLDPHPTEIHYFVSYYLPMALYVSTAQNDLLWLITLGQSQGTLAIEDLAIEEEE